ncbi:aldehyde dehydrogenase [Sphingosinicella microcystinivorans]|uniref:aldehyde dehydrogenase n=1 Tax=Sphingosinicella microcystinivorans TaxID=335406 RepID=UPI0022F3E8C2|nr:aldehyde dehydrogenase [Sphingosinicella microcystinivorans]WBX86452.1 aldehyde dehydrogenase [Sphingosinicella microcystinivorans]
MEYRMLIGGEAVAAKSGETFESVNPYDQQPWARVPRAGPEDVDTAVAAAREAFTTGPWPRLTPTERGRLLRNLGDLVASHAEELATLETRDNGKLYSEMLTQLRYIPQWYYYFGGLADKIEGMVHPVDKPDIFNFSHHEPYGVVAAITAWNSPLLLAAYKLAPALAAGNTVVLKPSEHASCSTLRFAELFALAGFPPGVVNVISGFGPEIGDALTGHPDVAKITFTGSATTGRRINAVAGQDFKSVTLELGGKSPNIVFADADLDNAANGAIAGILAASGQTCVAGSRLLVEDSIHDAFLERVVAIARTARSGDPMDPATNIGPVATKAQYDKIRGYLEIAEAEGAERVLGGTPDPDPAIGKGWFIEPTIYANVTNAMRIAREEVFGPVLSVIRFRDEDEAVHIANDTRYGLAAGIWSQNLKRCIELPKRLRAGTVWVNTYRAVSYMTPFGGFKASGTGKENGIEAIRQYLQLKSVWLSTADSFSNPFTIR